MKSVVANGRSRIDKFVYQHPYVSFAVFLAIMFGFMALVGLNDMGDRVTAIGGV